MNITDKIFPSTVQYESNNLQSSEYQLNQEVSSNLSVEDASDDPTAYGQATALRANESQNSVYLASTTAANETATSTYDAASSLQSIMTNVGELVTEMNAATGTQTYADYGAQMATYASEIANVANTETDGVYLFGGTSNQPPLTAITSTDNSPSYELNAANNNTTSSYTIGQGITTSAGLPIGSSTYSTTSTTAIDGTLAASGITGGTIDVNGTSVAISSTDTLSDVASEINAAGITGVTASVSDGKLSLSSATGAVTVTDVSPSTFAADSGLSTATATVPTAGLLSTGGSGTLDLYTLVATIAQDLQNAGSSGDDPFTGDSVLAGVTDSDGNPSNSIGGVVALVDAASSFTSQNVGKTSAQLSLYALNTNALNATNTDITSTISNLTSANTAAAATSLTEVQTAYSAALDAASKILSLNILQYIT